MYGLINKLLIVEEKIDYVITILLENSSKLPGCLNYIISKDKKDKNAIWITEIWNEKESHDSSLQIKSVQESIVKVKPYITGFGKRYETEPFGGYGIIQKN